MFEASLSSVPRWRDGAARPSFATAPPRLLLTADTAVGTLLAGRSPGLQVHLPLPALQAGALSILQTVHRGWARAQMPGVA